MVIKHSVTLKQQRHGYENLRRKYNSLRGDLHALTLCLEEHGIRRQTLSQPDRSHAESKLTDVSSREPVAFADILEARVLRAVLQWCAGVARGELLALKESSPCLKSRVEAVQAEKIYVFAGADAAFGEMTNAAECFDPRQGAWRALKPIYLRRAGLVAGVVGGRILVCGGFTCLGRNVETFIPKFQAWDNTRPSPKLSTVRQYAAGVTMGGRLYICGGMDWSAKVSHRSVEFFEQGPGGGKPCGGVLPFEMRQGRQHFAAAALPGQDRALLATGGFAINSKECQWQVGDSLSAYDSAELLTLSGEERGWRDVAAMASPRMCHSLSVLRGKVYAIGGTPDGTEAMASIECWCPQAGRWSTVRPMPAVRSNHCAAVFNGGLYVLGGLQSHRQGTPAMRSCYRMDLEKDVWEEAPSMLKIREASCCVVVKLAGLAACTRSK